MGILGVTLHDDARREEPGDRGRHLQLTREEREGGQAAAGRAQPLVALIGTKTLTERIHRADVGFTVTGRTLAPVARQRSPASRSSTAAEFRRKMIRKAA